jgi:anion-transporting  ArsA/GET3 family ATPase
MSPLPSTPLVVVTGKGGVGKTTVACALGLALARRGLRTVVAEVGGQSRAPELLGAESGRPGREIAVHDGLFAVTIDPVEGLGEWLASLLPQRMASVLAHSGTFGAFVAAAPGVAELVAIVKAWELGEERRWRKGCSAFDVVVLDAPATGHAIGMLRTAQTYADIARVGPIASQARKVQEALRDPARTSYVAATIPTELAVTETLELEDRLRDAVGQRFSLVVANGVLPAGLEAPEAAAVAVAGDAVPAAARRAVAAAGGRAGAQAGQLDRLLADLGPDHVRHLPFRFTAGFERADIEALADELDRLG